jgi:hypothetical protein
MHTSSSDLTDLPRYILLAEARNILSRQAELIYDVEALSHVVGIFFRNTELMTDEQLVHIVRRGE